MSKTSDKHRHTQARHCDTMDSTYLPHYVDYCSVIIILWERLAPGETVLLANVDRAECEWCCRSSG